MQIVNGILILEDKNSSIKLTVDLSKGTCVMANDEKTVVMSGRFPKKLTQRLEKKTRAS